MQETKSNWASVAEQMKNEPPIIFGENVSHCFYREPRKMLNFLSYYKFAAKLIGVGKKVLDIGCDEGLGTVVIGKECGFAKGIDVNEVAIEAARGNFTSSNVEFEVQNVLQKSTQELWDAVISFGFIENVLLENVSKFFKKITSSLKEDGLAVIGTPSLISQQFVSETSKKGYVNIYSPERLEKEMKEHFEFVFMFAANDEVVHAGFLPLAEYLIVVGCKKKNK
ncbi:MAG: class I SAM-dependent methyltransferase [Chlamydiales bacterium]|nr:class I SAM-dependent methyltransferase [Chlamydiales bacterium]